MDARTDFDFLIAGGGIVGSAIAYGLARRGATVVVLDEGDTALRAARANFGLVWVQGKGDGMPDYARWTRRSAMAWPDFAAELTALTGLSTEHHRPGGVEFCLGEAGYLALEANLARLNAQSPLHDGRMLSRTEVQWLMPRLRLGPQVTGGSFSPQDGAANPLRLLMALHAGMQKFGAVYRPDAPCRAIRADTGGFSAETPVGRFTAARVVVAAGHGTPGLAAPLGLAAPMRPERGEILVTERLAPLLGLPCSGLRQTASGGFLIGSTYDNPGFDTATTVPAAQGLAAWAIQVAPVLARARVVRQWAGLRVLTPDSHPVYMQSRAHPGAFVAVCHSGVTLAAVHATALADALLAGALPPEMAAFHPDRFTQATDAT